MKRTTVIFLIAALTVFLVAPNVQEAVVLFLLVGAIPGTSLSIPPLIMLSATIIALLLVLHWTKKQEFYARVQASHTKQVTPNVAKKTTPRVRKSRRRVANQTA